MFSIRKFSLKDSFLSNLCPELSKVSVIAPMSEILRDPFWQFVIVVLIGVLAIIAAVIIYLKQRLHKNISYEIISKSSLLSVNDEIKQDVQISFKGKLVQQVSLIILRIFNSGNVPVLSTDFESPIAITLGKNAIVLTAEIIDKQPDCLPTLITSEDSRIILAPTLLNPRDSVTLRMLVTNLETIDIDSRIAGVRKIQLMTHGKRDALLELMGLINALFLTFAIIGVLNILQYGLQLGNGGLTISMAVIAVLLFLIKRRLSN